MIKNTDVRISNLILGVSDRVEKIVAIGENYCYTQITTMPSTPQELVDVKGIPLTEAWLLKLGFKLSGSWYEIRGNNIELSIYLPEMKASMCEFDKEQDSIYFPIPNNSVHWLQNWFYFITGQELQLTT